MIGNNIDYIMIKTKDDLKFYIKEDYKNNIGRIIVNGNFFMYLKCWLAGIDAFLAYRYLKSLRKLKYVINVYNDYGIIGNLLYYYYLRCRGKWVRRCNIVIAPNTVSYDLRLPHISGGGIVINYKSMGCRCQVNTGVVIGKKYNSSEVSTIGNNVEFSPGAVVIGNITIGNYAMIALNSVAVKNVGSGEVVSGIPAKVIKIRAV